jgi:hypothetical protein
MTQALDIITLALQSIGASAPGEQIDSTLTTQAFTMLNMLLERASNEKFMVVSINEVVQSLPGGVTAVTIGPGATINTTRPLAILSAFARVSSIDYKISILNIEQYELIGLKQQPGAWPTALYYQSTSPIGTINFWPLPNAFEAHLFCTQIFSNFVTLNDTVQFPPGYNLWMMWELAYALLPAYGRASNQGLVAMVQDELTRAKAAIKRTNMQPEQVVQFDRHLLNGPVNDAGWIMHGGF